MTIIVLIMFLFMVANFVYFYVSIKNARFQLKARIEALQGAMIVCLKAESVERELLSSRLEKVEALK